MSKTISRVTTRARVANIEKMLQLLEKSPYPIPKLTSALAMTSGCVHGYVKTAVAYGAVKTEQQHRPDGRTVLYVTLESKDAARRMIEAITPPAPVPNMSRNMSSTKRKTINQQRIADALAAGRRFVVDVANGDKLRIPHRRPAFRCEFETLFFGPAKVTT